MAEEFLPLARWIAARVVPTHDPTPATPQEEEPNETIPEMDNDVAAVDDVVEDVRRFRAALADALDLACADLLVDIAVDVVGRELHVQPAQIHSIVARTLARYAHEFPLAVRVHPDDADALSSEYPTVADERLRRGDAVIEVRSGTIDARLGVRVERLLRRFA